jgi:hypothetical protein
MLAGVCPALHATTYYVDAAAGNDGNSGISPSLAWSTLASVNQHKFAPGDQILFHAGQAWTGVLEPHPEAT